MPPTPAPATELTAEECRSLLIEVLGLEQDVDDATLKAAAEAKAAEMAEAEPEMEEETEEEAPMKPAPKTAKMRSNYASIQ